MAKRATPLDCSSATLAEFTTMQSRREEVRIEKRSRIVLACLEGKQIEEVARELVTAVLTVSKWRRRFAACGVDGLRDQPRSGKPPTYGADFRGRVLSLLEQPPPTGLGQWDGRAVADTLGASVHAVWRLLRRE